MQHYLQIVTKLKEEITMISIMRQHRRQGQILERPNTEHRLARAACLHLDSGIQLRSPLKIPNLAPRGLRWRPGTLGFPPAVEGHGSRSEPPRRV